MIDDPNFIATRLSSASGSTARGDAVTAERLLASGDLTEFDEDQFGPLFSSGIPYEKAIKAKDTRTPAAVLVALMPRDEGLSVLLTRRTEHLPTHKGQIAFPGGRIDPGDEGPEGAALREAHEETNLPPDQVKILGSLDPYITVTNYEVTPVVGHISGPVDLKPEPGEVDEIFWVPLAFLMDPQNHRRETRMFRGSQRAYYAIPYDGRYIWGATAGMLMNLYEVLSRS